MPELSLAGVAVVAAVAFAGRTTTACAAVLAASAWSVSGHQPTWQRRRSWATTASSSRAARNASTPNSSWTSRPLTKAGSRAAPNRKLSTSRRRSAASCNAQPSGGTTANQPGDRGRAGRRRSALQARLAKPVSTTAANRPASSGRCGAASDPASTCPVLRRRGAAGRACAPRLTRPRPAPRTATRRGVAGSPQHTADHPGASQFCLLGGMPRRRVNHAPG
jgi:hypothetical protein